MEAYIYGYPLVTMELTRRDDERGDRRGHTRADGPVRQHPAISVGKVPRRDGPQRGYALFDRLARPVKEPYLLSLPDKDDRYFLMPMLSGCTDVFEVPGTRTTGNSPKLRDHRAGLEGHAAWGGQGVRVADEHGLDSGPDLLHWQLEDYKACTR